MKKKKLTIIEMQCQIAALERTVAVAKEAGHQATEHECRKLIRTIKARIERARNAVVTP